MSAALMLGSPIPLQLHGYPLSPIEPNFPATAAPPLAPPDKGAHDSSRPKKRSRPSDLCCTSVDPHDHAQQDPTTPRAFPFPSPLPLSQFPLPQPLPLSLPQPQGRKPIKRVRIVSPPSYHPSLGCGTGTSNTHRGGSNGTRCTGSLVAGAPLPRGILTTATATLPTTSTASSLPSSPPCSPFPTLNIGVSSSAPEPALISHRLGTTPAMSPTRAHQFRLASSPSKSPSPPSDLDVSHPVAMPPSPRSLRSSPPSILQKRPNATRKHLSLSLFVPPTGQHLAPATPTSPAPPTITQATSTESTPYTPGPPRTPALAMSLPTSISSARTKGLRRPSLLSLITQPPTADDVPPTPSQVHPYASMRRSRARQRASTLDERPADRAPAALPSSRSAYPSYGFPQIGTISEHPASDDYSSAFHQPRQSSPASSVSSSTSTTASTSPSSPPIPSTSFSVAFPSLGKSLEPYGNGPVEVLPGIFLGAENSVWAMVNAASTCAPGPSSSRRTVRILNVAQEIENPFVPPAPSVGKGKEKVKLAAYLQEGVDVEYGHLRWSHGEAGLAELPPAAELRDLLAIDEPILEHGESGWKFWEAIRWLESARTRGVPVLIHCQCGVSRSATLVIAYVVALAAAGIMPEHLGHIRGMQDAYDFVKAKSPWVGPNVSLVFQLVEFVRAITPLLAAHIAQGHPKPLTAFPTMTAEMSEAEWARRRREFDLAHGDEEDQVMSPAVPAGTPAPFGLYALRGGLSPEEAHEAGEEARVWDEAMLARKGLLPAQ